MGPRGAGFLEQAGHRRRQGLGGGGGPPRGPGRDVAQGDPAAPPPGPPGLEGVPAGAAQLFLAGRLAVVPLFVLALLRTAAESFSPFLYFQF